MALLPPLLTAIALLSGPEDPERHEPEPGAPAHTVFAWSSRGGLRYTWVLPPGYDGQEPRHLTVILHGTGLDYRWGHWNNKPGIFRPDDIVVSVDGTSPGQGDSRLFLGEQRDAQVFREFLAEMRATFAVDRIFLYGHSQGGFFVVYYAGEAPETVSGVVAHASGAWNWSHMPRALERVAIAFMHGSNDPVVPYWQSPASFAEYRKRFELVHLRRLDRYTHWPNAVRATETLDWCQGMTAPKPEEALECALDMLRRKPADEYQWETLVDYAGAYDVLRRIAGAGPAPFPETPEGLESTARRWLDAIEEAARRHVARLERELPKKGLVLERGSWLGHLVPLREDFRGVPPVERLVKELRYDKLAAEHAKARTPIVEAWYGDKPPPVVLEAVLANLERCFLFDGFPPELATRVREWHSQGIELPPKVARKYADFEAWQEGWEQGLAAYQEIWRDWRGPE